MIIFTKIPRKIKIGNFGEGQRVYYLWAPMSHQISHTLKVLSILWRLFSNSIMIQIFLRFKPFSFSALSTWTRVQPSINCMTENLLCFFLLDIFFSNLFTSFSSYINTCLHFHTHHSQFLILCIIQSLPYI